ncbi:MAG: clostripain-related cysteine peptidase [Candidatus Rifleibacteriota bacterium]
MKRVLSISILAAFLISTFAVGSVQAAEMKEWTLAVFLNADNNLDRFGVEDQEEMSRVGSNENLNIVSLIDRERGPAQINYIEKDNIRKVKDMGELDMGDYRQFINFIKYVKKNYPAKRYAVTFWNHGSGWKNKNENVVVRGISYDDSSNNHITNAQLRVALRESKKILGQKIDILNFDACLMQMVEVNYACKDYVKYVVASEENEPGKGAPYDDILKGVKKGMSAEAFARHWVKAFCGSYNGGSQGHDESTQSAIDVSKLQNMVDALNGFAKTSMSGKYARGFSAIFRKVQKYSYPQNIDLIHFVELASSYFKNDEAMQTACKKIKKAADELIIEEGKTGYSTKNSNGIAIYFPHDYVIEPKYKKIGFAKDTMWDEMILELRNRNMVNKIVDNVKEGKLDSLKKMIAFAKRNSAEKSLYRYMVRELKYEFLQENKVKPSIENEFNKLLEELTKIAVN